MEILEKLNSFGKLSNFEIKSIEEKLGIVFSEDYRDFISKTNGGFLQNGYLVVNVPGLSDELLIHSFLGMSDDENFDIVGWNNEYQRELPDSTFIFGIEYGGGMFIQITEGSEKGIYFWDSNFSLPNTSEKENVFFIAKSFLDFLSMIIYEE